MDCKWSGMPKLLAIELTAGKTAPPFLLSQVGALTLIRLAYFDN